jgi:centromeric protein E
MPRLQGAKINQSLLTLGRVFQHLADKPAHGNTGGAKTTPSKHHHIPYRDSNLTRLLQPVLGGNSKTAIIAAIAPGRSSLENTKATLHFVSVAARVRASSRSCTNYIDCSVPLSSIGYRFVTATQS